MKNIIPRVAGIQDLSGFGRCSLTVIIPVLSSMGIQVCPLPTAILSTHSGGFGDFHFIDLTGEMNAFASHWEKLGIPFDAIYTGFLGSSLQIDIVLDLFSRLGKEMKPMLVVDPVMGDNRKLYKTYTPDMQQKMRLLVQNAHIITPNLTEAFFLLDEPYNEKALTTTEMKSLLTRLSDLGPETVVITSVTTTDGYHANIGYDRNHNSFWKVAYDYIPVHYPGTGDIFTSVLLGSLFKDDSLPLAMDRATQFVSMAVRVTYGHRTPEREGVLLEKVLGWLKNDLMISSYHTL